MKQPIANRVPLPYPVGSGVEGDTRRNGVDPWFLVELAPEKADIIKRARLTNDGMPMYTAKRAQRLLEEYKVENGKVAVLGLAFKGNVDDMRESPATTVADSLLELGLNVVSFDPHIKELQHPTQVATLEEAIDDADLLLLTTDHDEFKNYDPAQLQTKQPRPILLDTKNALDAAKWEQAGYRFFKLGDGKKEGQLYK